MPKGETIQVCICQWDDGFIYHTVYRTIAWTTVDVFICIYVCAILQTCCVPIYLYCICFVIKLIQVLCVIYVDLVVADEITHTE